MSGREFAEQLGVQPQTVSSYERGVNAVDDDRAEIIADVLRLPLLDVRRGLGLWVPDADEQPLPDDPDERLEVLLDQAAGILREGGVLGRKEVDSAVDYLRFLATQQATKRDKSGDE